MQITCTEVELIREINERSYKVYEALQKLEAQVYAIQSNCVGLYTGQYSLLKLRINDLEIARQALDNYNEGNNILYNGGKK